MSQALGEGYLVAILVAFIPLVLAVSRWVAGKWRNPLRILQEENGLLKKEALERTEKLTDVRIENMKLGAKIEYCEGELENWRAGRWRSP